MKFVCKENHWQIKDGQLLLDTPAGYEAVQKTIKVLEREIRTRIYNEICSYPLTDNRAQIVKHGLENSLLAVQDICAKIALGETND
jgi:hypothetical protein